MEKEGNQLYVLILNSEFLQYETDQTIFLKLIFYYLWN